MKESIQKTTDGGAIHTMENDEGSIQVKLTDVEGMMTRLLRAAKEPDDDTKERLARERKQREEFLASVLNDAKRQIEARERNQQSCQHRKQDGSTTVHQGQIYSDGMIKPICVRCQRTFTPYPAPRELMGGQGIPS